MSASTGKEWLAKISKLLLRRTLPLFLVASLAAVIFIVSELAIDTRLRARNVELTYELDIGIVPMAGKTLQSHAIKIGFDT